MSARVGPHCQQEFTPLEPWYKLCRACYAVQKRREAAQEEVEHLRQLNADLVSQIHYLRTRLAAVEVKPQTPHLAIPGDQLRRLLQLCHPDKHGGSEAANEATAWLLSQRKRSRGASVRA